MLKFKDQQIRAFERAAGRERFEDDAVVHFQKLVPRHADMIKESGLRRVIRLGVDRAAQYEIFNPGLLQFYIELMFCFGSQFDSDPLLPWAGAVLRDPEIVDEVTRTERLYQAMTDYLQEVAEPGTAMSLAALRNVKQAHPENYRLDEPDFEDQAILGMQQIYPERCQYLGEQRLRELVQRGPSAAAACGLSSDRGVALTIGLLFIIGHGFATDPLQPWIQATLDNPKITNAERRAQRLERRMRIYLDVVLEYLEERRANVQA